MRRRQRGQVLVIVAVWMVALIGSAALVLLAGSVEWQRSQLQQLADQAALDAALKIGVGCSGASASTVITEADNFLATQRTRTGSLSIAGASCTGPYTGTDTFATGLSETVDYPYRLHQQQVEVVLTLSLPISFGSYMGATNTTVTRRAVAQQLRGSTSAVSATTLSCTGGQFNVAGSVRVSSTISLSGACALYAHQRFDPTSGTYSDLGNVSVYNPGQAWVNGGGACVAGGNAGSTNAICADGFELSGHATVGCGTGGTSAYLSAGNIAINPNPCAAGKAPQPATAVSATLPPEPNLDPAAVATLPGGTACTAGASYPNLVVAGATVGTAEAGTPAPTKDAGGFYHFKPSCYGYLDFTSMKSGIASRQLGTELAGARHFVTPTLPAASQAGTLLVVTLTADPNWGSTAAPSAKWKLAASMLEGSSARVEIWYYPNNPGGIRNSETWTVLPASSNVAAQMTEWTGVDTTSPSPLDVANATKISVATTTALNTAAGPTTNAGDLVITNEGYAVAAGTFTAGAGWNALVNDPPNDMSSEYRNDLGIGIPSETVTTTSATTWALAIAAFKPAAGGGGVLDPGFYYFNGSGFPGGGGVCLNGAKVLARDVTMEFVNQAGFSTGTCLAGGGVGCAVGLCQFGSTPCSISACPPNAAADAASGGYTWFAAPCSQAPAGDASCAGSAWCPVGDRACWNLLVWSASNAGQVSLKGAGSRHWLLGSVFWAGTCTDAVNGTSTIDGTLYCATLAVSAAAGAGTAIGSDYGVNTALVEAVLLE